MKRYEITEFKRTLTEQALTIEDQRRLPLRLSYSSLFKSYNHLIENCSNLIIPSTLNPDLIFYFAFGFALSLGPNFSFNLVTDQGGGKVLSPWNTSQMPRCFGIFTSWTHPPSGTPKIPELLP